MVAAFMGTSLFILFLCVTALHALPVRMYSVNYQSHSKMVSDCIR